MTPRVGDSQERRDPATVVQLAESSPDDWYPVRTYTVERPRPGFGTARVNRQVCHRGDSAAVLLLDDRRGTVLLTRQFRLPTLLNGHPDGRIVEIPGGLLDGQTPSQAGRREVAEETGVRVRSMTRVLVAYLTPCLVTERVHLFVAGYEEADRCGAGGGVWSEGEDIEVLEVPVRQAYSMAERGEIVDAKTLLLLYYVAAHGIVDLPRWSPSGGGQDR